MLDRSLGTEGAFGMLANAILAADLPALPAERRLAAVRFAAGRAAMIPTPLRLGVGVLCTMLGVPSRLFGAATVARRIASTGLPLVAELPRLVRSLGYSYIWETWPDTAPDGAPR